MRITSSVISLALFSIAFLGGRSQALAQPSEASFEALKTQSTLCEARYRNGGFTSATSFVVGCLNPVFETFFNENGAPSYLYESVKAQTLLMGAKVDSNEIEFDDALKNIAGVANVAISSLGAAETSANETAATQAPPPKVDAREVELACRRAAEVARSNVLAQYDDQWAAFVASNPPPAGRTALESSVAIMNSANPVYEQTMRQMQDQQRALAWRQQMEQTKRSMQDRGNAAAESAFRSSLELCKIQNGL